MVFGLVAETPAEGGSKLLEHHQSLGAELQTMLTMNVIPFSDSVPLMMQSLVLTQEDS